MGSILAGLYANRRLSALKSLILMGTPAPNPTAGLGIFIANIKILFSGYESESKLLTNLMNKACDAVGDTPDQRYAWLSRDTAQVKLYYLDDDCGFAFSASALKEMFAGLKEFSAKSWGGNIDIPTLIIAGDDDAAGNRSKGPKHYYNLLKSNGCDDVTLKLVEGARHEVLNETNKDDTILFLKEWLCAHCI